MAFEQREQRSAEEPGLLAGDHDARRGIGQAGRRLTRASGVTAHLPFGEHVCQLGGPTRRGLRARDGVGPASGVAGLPQRMRDPDSVERVIGRQPANPRELSDIDRP